MDAEFWVAVGFVIFLGCAAYLGVHSKIGVALDARGKRIKDELAEAQRFREEAAAVLASFERKRVEAEKEAAAIVEQARVEAEFIAKEAEERLNDFVKRRTAQAEAKIATAETAALAQVRSSAADAATAAAEIVLKGETKTGLADRLIQQSIADVKRLAH
jgi:F-type H+-transporting ATPase subunit b